jgi:outer membrane protein assembly factor BamB
MGIFDKLLGRKKKRVEGSATPIRLPVALKWSTVVAEESHISSPIVWKGLVYVACSDSIIALCTATGEIVWRFGIDSGVTNPLGISAPTVAGNKVYVPCKKGRLYALDSNSGDICWIAETCGEPRSPVAVENYVYAAVTDSFLYCLKADDGVLCWKIDTGSKVFNSPTPYRDLLLLGTGDGLHVYERSNRRIKWQSDYGMGAVIGSPTVNDGIVYALNSNGLLFAHRVENGKPVWEWPAIRLGGITGASPVVGNRGIVYAITHEPLYKGLWLHAIDPSAPYDCMELWDFKSQDFESDGLILWNLSPALAGDYVFMGSLSSYLYIIDAVSGKKLWRIETRARMASTPCIATGCVYISDGSGTVYAFASHP